MWSSVQLVSVLGSLLVLVAYVASQFGRLSAKGLAYAFAFDAPMSKLKYSIIQLDLPVAF